jgi:hypothetical protein
LKLDNKWIKCTKNWFEPPCVIVIINFATDNRQWFIFKIHFKNLRILVIRNNCFYFHPPNIFHSNIHLFCLLPRFRSSTLFI